MYSLWRAREVAAFRHPYTSVRAKDVGVWTSGLCNVRFGVANLLTGWRGKDSGWGDPEGVSCCGGEGRGLGADRLLVVDEG